MNRRINRYCLVQASALSYAVFIMIVVLILLTSIIVLAHLNSRIISNSNIGLSLQSYVNSGINILLANENDCNMGESKSLVLIGIGKDTIELSRDSWGVFDLCKVRAKEKHQQLSKIFLSGGYNPEMNNMALFLADQKRPLSICGDTRIIGDCFLPSAGVKRTIIDGRMFTGNQSIEGKVRYSGPELPALHNDLSNKSHGYFISRYILENGNKIIEWEEVDENVMENSFYNDPIIIYSPARITLSHIGLESNIIVISEKCITVEAGCVIEDVILSAPSIIINRGFKGAVQCFATDSLLLWDSCHLNYPSALVLSNIHSTTSVFCKIYCGSKISGIIISNTYHNPKSKNPVLVIEQTALVEGQLWCNSFLEMSGGIHGSAYVKSFYLKTPSSIYENHLLDAVFSIEELPDYYTGIELCGNENIQRIVKWLR